MEVWTPTHWKLRIEATKWNSSQRAGGGGERRTYGRPLAIGTRKETMLMGRMETQMMRT